MKFCAQTLVFIFAFYLSLHLNATFINLPADQVVTMSFEAPKSSSNEHLVNFVLNNICKAFGSLMGPVIFNSKTDKILIEGTFSVSHKSAPEESFNLFMENVPLSEQENDTIIALTHHVIDIITPDHVIDAGYNIETTGYGNRYFSTLVKQDGLFSSDKEISQVPISDFKKITISLQSVSGELCAHASNAARAVAQAISATYSKKGFSCEKNSIKVAMTVPKTNKLQRSVKLSSLEGDRHQVRHVISVLEDFVTKLLRSLEFDPETSAFIAVEQETFLEGLMSCFLCRDSQIKRYDLHLTALSY